MMAWAFLLLVFFVGHSHQLNNGLGLTPQMGKMEIISDKTCFGHHEHPRFFNTFKFLFSYRMEQLESLWMQY
jgi:hypothetical protein